MRKSFLTNSMFGLRLLAAAFTCCAFVGTAGAHIAGTVFCDGNGNNILDPGEPGIPGVKVTICNVSKFTDANGDYLFTSADLSAAVCNPPLSSTDPWVVTVDPTTVTGDCKETSCPTSVMVFDTPADDVDFCFKKSPPGNGCPAKFWKDNQSKWVGYSPDAVIKTVFVNATKTVCSGFGDEGNKKLKDALGFGTGTGNLKDAFKNLMREAVAALLNASNPQLNYPATAAEIIQLVNDALATCDRLTLIDLANELKAANDVGSPFCQTTQTGNCTTDGKPNKLTLTYTGGSCASAVNSQPVGQKYNCSESNGGLTGASPVRIIVSSSSSVPTATSQRFFDGTVGTGSSFDVLGSFGSNTYFFVYENGVLKQFVQIHTSCSAPLIRGETFGGLELDDYAIVP